MEPLFIDALYCFFFFNRLIKNIEQLTKDFGTNQ